MSALPDDASAGLANLSPGTPGSGREPAARSGLRERKKARTRAAIREQAFRLFREQGYEATTVEQIADAAEVSPSTFFRYFPTKEDVVLQDDFDLLLAEAVRAQPPGLGPIAALRRATQDLIAGITPAELEQLRQSAELTMSIPAVRARSLDEMARTIGIIARLAGERSGRNPDDIEVRTYAGAVLGVAMATWFATSGDLAKFMAEFERAIALLEAGLPL